MIKIKDKRINYISILIFILILLLNFLTVKTADDYGYANAANIIDVFMKEFNQYMTWNGRSIAHIIDRTFLMLPKFIFNIANSLVFVYFIRLIYRNIKGNAEKDNIVIFSLVFMSIFLFVPFFGQTILWETGSCNYLWMMTIILQFLLFFRNNSNINPILLFLLGILAGWSNENTGGACIMIAVMLTIYHYISNKKINKSLILGIAGACIGFLILVLAPGNAIRAAEYANSNMLIYNLVHETIALIDVYREGLLLLIISYLFFVAIGKKEKNIIIVSFIYFLAALADIAAILLSPSQMLWDRSMFGSPVLMIIAAGIVLYNLNFKEKLNIYLIYAIFSIMLVTTVFNYGEAVIDLTYTAYQDKKRNDYIIEQKNNGNLYPIVYKIDSEFYTKYNARYGLGDIAEYKDYFINLAYVDNYDLNQITATNIEKWNLVYRDGDSALMGIIDFNQYLEKVLSNDDYILLINTIHLDDRFEEYITILNKYGIDMNKYNNYAGVLSKGSIINENYSVDGCYIDGDLYGNYYYIASYKDGTDSDIAINNIKYSNNQDGIALVVYSVSKNKVVDSVSYVLDHGTNGIRFEKTNP